MWAVPQGQYRRMKKPQFVHSFSDAARTNSKDDRFRRAPFAKRIAETLSSLPDENSIAIGIYGPWGDGKTTLLAFIEEELRKNNQIITMYFNPWRFGDEDELLENFFASLVEQVGKSLSGVKTFINEWKELLKVAPYVGDAAEILARKLTFQGLEELKRKTENILKKAGKRIVVLMDDIDRLETKEIQSVFRLIKLTGSFNYVAYVLAFDDKVVSAALQEKYGTALQSGQGFLEKIIQVPLHLPKIPATVLLEFCYECVSNALSATDFQLTKEQEKAFRDNFTHVAMQIHTPRQCKRYANGITFALGVLKGEVNPVDLLLVEALRVFNPDLYKIIRSHKDYFVSGTGTSSLDPRTFESEELETGWQGLTTSERVALRELLQHLFPDFGKGALQRQKIGLYDPFADDQRISSEHYFDRFFTYSIPASDIPDANIDALLRIANRPIDNIADRPIDKIASQIQAMMDIAAPHGVEAFIFRIGLRRKLLGPTISPTLARGIAVASDMYPCFSRKGGQITGYSEAVLLIRQLLLNTGGDLFDDSRSVMMDIVNTSPSLYFAYWCLQAASDTKPQDQKSWFQVYGSTGVSDDSTSAPISKNEYSELARAMGKRLKSYFDEPSSYDIARREESRLLVEQWVHCASAEEVREHLEKHLRKNPSRAIALINWYFEDPSNTEVVWQDHYDKLTRLVGIDVLLDALQREYGDKLQMQQPTDQAVMLAQAFVRLCMKSKESSQRAS
jgi:Ni2+-binding GTPase involved in maturation of urease and hydrogenase